MTLPPSKHVSVLLEMKPLAEEVTVRQNVQVMVATFEIIRMVVPPHFPTIAIGNEKIFFEPLLN